MHQMSRWPLSEEICETPTTLAAHVSNLALLAGMSLQLVPASFADHKRLVSRDGEGDDLF